MKVLTIYFGRKAVTVRNPRVVEAFLESVDLSRVSFEVREEKVGHGAPKNR